MPQTADDVTPHPLGAPVNRPGPQEPPEGRWVPVDPARPYMQRNTVTGQWRNVRPAPPALPNPWILPP